MKALLNIEHLTRSELLGVEIGQLCILGRRLDTPLRGVGFWNSGRVYDKSLP